MIWGGHRIFEQTGDRDGQKKRVTVWTALLKLVAKYREGNLGKKSRTILLSKLVIQGKKKRVRKCPITPETRCIYLVPVQEDQERSGSRILLLDFSMCPLVGRTQEALNPRPLKWHQGKKRIGNARPWF